MLCILGDTMNKTLILIINILITGTILANNNINNIATIENRALKNSDLYKQDINRVILQSDHIVANANFNKQEFLKLQNGLLKKYYRNHQNNKDTIVFVSFSMPDESIKNLLKESAKYEASLVLNGLYNNSMDATLKKLGEFINKENNSSGIEINPNLFQEYQIKSVPAFVFKKNDNFDVVYGASGIRHAIDVIDKKAKT